MYLLYFCLVTKPLELELQFFKALHIIGFVSWFAGLFFLGRLFVYHKEAEEKPEHEKKILQQQLEVMQKRVYQIICNPAMMITWICGLAMIYLYGMIWFKASTWLHVKLVLVISLVIYHLYCKVIIRKQAYKLEKGTSTGYRLFNEVPTLFLAAIVFLAVMKNLTNFAYLFGGVVLFGIILFLIVKLYNSKTQNQQL